MENDPREPKDPIITNLCQPAEQCGKLLRKQVAVSKVWPGWLNSVRMC
jgi:hypothetical protein